MNTKKTFDITRLLTFEWISLAALVGLFFIIPAFSLFGVTAWWFYFIANHRDFLLNVLGDIGLGKRNYTRAISSYKQCARTTVARMKYVKKYVIIEIKHGSADKAEITLDKIIKARKPKWVKDNEKDLSYLRALIAWKKGEIDRSLDILNTIFKEEKSQEIYGTISYMKLIKGNYEESLEFSKQAHTVYPNDIISKSIFAISAYLNEDIELADELFEELVAHNLNIPDTFYYYAKYMISKGELKKAEVALRKGLKLLNTTIICSISKDQFGNLLDEVIDELDTLEDENDENDGFDDDNDGFDDEIATEEEN